MPVQDQISTADAADRHRRRMGFAMLAIAVMYAAKAAETAGVARLDSILDPIQVAMAILAMGLLLPVVYWKLRKLPSGERHLYLSPDGFVMDALIRAQKISWATTFLLLMLIEVLMTDRDYPTELPGGFFVQLAIAVMLGVASVAFLVLSRADEEPDAVKAPRD